MADAGNGQLLTFVTALSPVLTAIVGFFLPRFWQDNLRQLQSESETRVKRLEALEKALSVVETAKAKLAIEVTDNDLQNELKRILHEFAGPTVLSRESLEEWSRQSLSFRFNVSPDFTVPLGQAPIVRNSKYALLGFMLGIVAYFAVYALDAYNFRHLVHDFFEPLGITSDFWLVMVQIYYFVFVYFCLLIQRFVITRRALRIVRAMPESRTVERTGSLPAEPSPQVAGKDDLRFA
jgi:hypothetical protein